jgi:hypothetical protein
VRVIGYVREALDQGRVNLLSPKPRGFVAGPSMAAITWSLSAKTPGAEEVTPERKACALPWK